MSTTRPATVHYRNLVRENAVGIGERENLSDAIRSALGRTHPNGGTYRDNWKHRLAPVPIDAEQKRLVNDLHDDGASVFGTLCSFTPGELQTLIDANAAAGPSAALADTRAPGGNEYLKGVAYWLVVGDHCYIVQHAALRAKAFEEYLTWLLRDETFIVAEGGSIILKGAFDVVAGGNLGDVQSIEIGGLMPDPDRARDDQPAQVEERRRLTERRAFFDRADAILELVFGRVGLDNIKETKPPDADLDVIVNVGYRRRRRQVEIDSGLMNDLAARLRNIDDGEIKVRGKDGEQRGENVWLKVDMPFRRIREGSNLLDLEHTRDTMLEVHRRFLMDDRIG